MAIAFSPIKLFSYDSGDAPFASGNSDRIVFVPSGAGAAPEGVMMISGSFGSAPGDNFQLKAMMESGLGGWLPSIIAGDKLSEGNKTVFAALVQFPGNLLFSDFLIRWQAANTSGDDPIPPGRFDMWLYATGAVGVKHLPVVGG